MHRPLITVRQTTDPYTDDIQYISLRDVSLERNGSLSISKIGLGKPGDNFFIISREDLPGSRWPVVSMYEPPSDIVHANNIRMMVTHEDGPNPILTVVESGDDASAYERHLRKMDAWEREKQLAYWKGLVTHAWNWVAPIFPSLPSRLMSKGSQRLDTPPIVGPEDLQPGNADSVSTCVSDLGNTSRLVRRRRTPKEDSGSWTR